MSGWSRGIRKIFAQSLFGAALGVGAGYAYVIYAIPPAIVEANPHLLGMYVSTGAVVGVVALRVFVIGREIYKDYFGAS